MGRHKCQLPNFVIEQMHCASQSDADQAMLWLPRAKHVCCASSVDKSSGLLPKLVLD